MISQALATAPAANDLGPPLEVLPPESPRERFDRLRDEAKDEIGAGRLKSALDLLERAVAVAREIGDAKLEAMALCNRAAVAISTGEVHEHVPSLRTILMRNFGVETSFAAAYNLAQAYESQKQYKKSLFYARIARDRSQAAGDDGFLAKSHSQIGLCLIGESFFQQATEHFEKSLELMPDGISEITVSPRVSLAYCFVVLGQPRKAMGQLFRCLRWMRSKKHRIYEPWAHLFLGCGHLELGRLRHAWLHVRRALTLAERNGEDEAVKSSLLMLGEVERAGGDVEAAYECFRDLQQRFYPDEDDYAEVLSLVSVARVVNLGY